MKLGVSVSSLSSVMNLLLMRMQEQPKQLHAHKTSKQNNDSQWLAPNSQVETTS